MSVARLRTYVGLAAAIVPCAIIVHLIAEAAAVGRAGLGIEFVARHAYFGVLFCAALLWFGSTAGVGKTPSERRRRCALMRADLGGPRGRHAIETLIGANIAFFALTQFIEGVPVASGSTALSLGIALAGSIAAALVVFFFGRAIATASIDSIIGCTPRRPILRVYAEPTHAVAAPRHVTATYSLLRPNRPPPSLSRI